MAVGIESRKEEMDRNGRKRREMKSEERESGSFPERKNEDMGDDSS